MVAADVADEAKRQAAEAAAREVVAGMRLGLGSGSTVERFVAAVGVRLSEGLSLPPVVAASRSTEAAARAVGLVVADMAGDGAPVDVDLTVDGADEIDGELRLIKGGGAALLREKIVARMARRCLIIADGSKRVDRLGAFALPVEVARFGWPATSARIVEAIAVEPTLRRGGSGEPLVTDNGNFILDCPCGLIEDPVRLADRLSALPGVMEHGLFLAEADDAIIADGAEVSRHVARR